MKKKGQKSKNSAVKSISCGVFIALVFSAICMACTSVLVIKTTIPEDMLKEIAIASSAAGIFIGSAVTSRISSAQKLVSGIAVGVCFYILRSIICLSAENSVIINDVSFGIAFCTLCASVGGALIGSKEEKRRKD